MTQNQAFALRVLGYLPGGYVAVTERFNSGAPWARTGSIDVNGRCVYMFELA